MNLPVRVFITDDHSLFRQGLKQLISTDSRCQIVGEAASARELMRTIRNLEFDVLLLDLSMSDNDGVEVIKQVKRLLPKMPVLVLTMHQEGFLASRAIQAGAAGYLTKDCGVLLLLEGIQLLARGGHIIDPSLVDSLLFKEGNDETPVHELLSDREYQIFKLLTDGKGVQDIAERLHISSKTVSTYKRRLMNKLGARSLAELVRYAVKRQI